MRINNSHEFVDFIKSNNLLQFIPEVGSLILCVDEHRRMCSCDNADVRDAKKNQCKTIYTNFLIHIQNYRNIIFSKTSETTITFYSSSVDSRPIVIINR